MLQEKKWKCVWIEMSVLYDKTTTIAFWFIVSKDNQSSFFAVA